MTRSRAHNLKIGDLPRTCACGNLCGSSGQCRECFLKANPDLAEYYAKKVVMVQPIDGGQVYDAEWFNRDVIAKRHADMTNGENVPLQALINKAGKDVTP